MKINVIVKPNSKKNSIAPNTDGSLVVHVNAPPIEGKANKILIELLADYFNVPKSSIEIVTGLKSKNKIIKVLGK